MVPIVVEYRIFFPVMHNYMFCSPLSLHLKVCSFVLPIEALISQGLIVHIIQVNRKRQAFISFSRSPNLQLLSHSTTQTQSN